MACIESDDGLYLHSVRFGAGPANDYGQRTMWRSKRASLSGRWTIVLYGTRTGNEVLPTTQTRVAAEPLRQEGRVENRAVFVALGVTAMVGMVPSPFRRAAAGTRFASVLLSIE